MRRSPALSRKGDATSSHLHSAGHRSPSQVPTRGDAPEPQEQLAPTRRPGQAKHPTEDPGDQGNTNHCTLKRSARHTLKPRCAGRIIYRLASVEIMSAGRLLNILFTWLFLQQRTATRGSSGRSKGDATHACNQMERQVRGRRHRCNGRGIVCDTRGNRHGGEFRDRRPSIRRPERFTGLRVGVDHDNVDHVADRRRGLHQPRTTVDFDSSAFLGWHRAGELLAMELKGTVPIATLPNEETHRGGVSDRTAVKRCQTARPASDPDGSAGPASGGRSRAAMVARRPRRGRPRSRGRSVPGGRPGA